MSSTSVVGGQHELALAMEFLGRPPTFDQAVNEDTRVDSVVTRDIPAHTVVAGNRARAIRDLVEAT